MNTTTVATTRDGSSTRRIEETDDGMIIIEESGNEIQEQDWVDRHRIATFQVFIVDLRARLRARGKANHKSCYPVIV